MIGLRRSNQGSQSISLPCALQMQDGVIGRLCPAEESNGRHNSDTDGYVCLTRRRRGTGAANRSEQTTICHHTATGGQPADLSTTDKKS